MRLSLSTAAAPELRLDELLDACARRGLRGLELVAGHAHGVSPLADEARLESARRSLAGAGVSVVAVRVDGAGVAVSSDAARLSVVLEAPILLSTVGVASLAARSELRGWAARAADLFATWGATLLLEHGGDPAHVAALHALVEAEGPGTLGLAWDADPADPSFTGSTEEVLAAAGSALEHIRLRGGGPESAMQEGQGIGSLMARLALAGYAGSIAVSPSTSKYRVAWEAWLGRRGWGCGSKVSDDSLVALEPLTISQGTMDEMHRLDVRPVEPKHRFETIMGGYESLPAGGVLELTVDHDPACMYYTLQAMRGDEAFDFEYLENGPEVWRVRVRRKE